MKVLKVRRGTNKGQEEMQQARGFGSAKAPEDFPGNVDPNKDERTTSDQEADLKETVATLITTTEPQRHPTWHLAAINMNASGYELIWRSTEPFTTIRVYMSLGVK